MGRSGFTLLEVVIALALAAMGLGAVFEATQSGLDNLDIATRSVTAAERAQAQLARIGVESGLVPGDRSGDDRDGFHWHVRIARVLAGRPAEGATSAVPTLYAVEVTVSWRERAKTRAIRLDTWRLGPSSNDNG